MRFTNSPYEKMMQEKPRYPITIPNGRPAPNSQCHDCPYRNGSICVGMCYREMIRGWKQNRANGRTYGQVVHTSHER